MRFVRPFALCLLMTAPAMAQPIIVPLEKQPNDKPPPVASAPPVAPPTAAPNATASVASGQPNQGPQEEAYQPPAR